MPLPNDSTSPSRAFQVTNAEASDDFETQLEQYNRQYRQTVENRPTNNKFVAAAGFATAAGSALAMAGGAEAAVIFSGPQNIYVAIAPTSFNTASSAIDIDGDGTPDLRFMISATYQPGYSTSSSAQSSQRMYVRGSSDMGVLQASVALDNSFSGPRKFSGMSSVGSAENWPGGPTSAIFNSGQNVVISYNMPRGNWSGTEAGTIGFRLKKGGDVHYGALRVELVDPTTPQGSFIPGDGLSDQVKIVDWIYESSPNTPILVPEPSGLAMLAAGAASLAAWRKRRAQAEADAQTASE